MNTLSSLQKQAIDAAARGDWQLALEKNNAIIEIDPQNIPALNRLGFCYLQVDKKKKAAESYTRVLEIEKLNPVARKYLDIIKKNIVIRAQSIDTSLDFVEEPGKSKVLELTRLAGNQTLEGLVVAMRCELKCKGRYITIVTSNNEYIGSLPEDISKHLTELIKTGNKYDCFIRSVSRQECSVFIKESLRSEPNLHTPSFYSAKITFTDDVLVDPTAEEGVIDSETNGDEVVEVEFEDNRDDDDGKEQIPLDVLGEVLNH